MIIQALVNEILSNVMISGVQPLFKRVCFKPQRVRKREREQTERENGWRYRAKSSTKKKRKKLMVGLQIIHSGPFIPGNTTHNWTDFQQKGNGPSRTINYSSCPVSFQKGYKTKAFSRNCSWKKRKALALSLTASNKTCVEVSKSQSPWERECDWLRFNPKVNNATSQESLTNLIQLHQQQHIS